MLFGFPLGIASVFVAFYRGTGMVFAGLAYLLVSFQVLFVAFLYSAFCDSMSFAGIGVIFVGCLGAYGVWRVTHPVVPPEHPRIPPRPVSFSAEPTSQPVLPEDVIGTWHFYLDAVAKTVSIRFHSDGAFDQTILENRGELIHCPGGTWKLAGAHVELTGYVTAEQGTAQSVTWWMIDDPSAPCLYGGDAPDRFVRITKV
jgi:hypothetical protein